MASSSLFLSSKIKTWALQWGNCFSVSSREKGVFFLVLLFWGARCGTETSFWRVLSPGSSCCLSCTEESVTSGEEEVTWDTGSVLGESALGNASELSCSSISPMVRLSFRSIIVALEVGGTVFLLSIPWDCVTSDSSVKLASMSSARIALWFCELWLGVVSKMVHEMQTKGLVSSLQMS